MEAARFNLSISQQNTVVTAVQSRRNRGAVSRLVAITHSYIFIRWGHYEIKWGEPLRTAELNHTATSLLKSGEEDIGAEMSEPPKAKHQKETVRDFCVLEERKGGNRSSEKQTQTQNIQLSNFQNITHYSHLSRSLCCE